MSFEIWLDDPLGQRLILVDQITSMNAVKATNNAGVLTLALPEKYDKYIRVDGIVEVWHDGKLFDAYFIRKWQFADHSNIPITIINAYNGISLLDRRIVAYAAGSAQSEITDYADDMMKDIVRYAATALATDTDRSWAANGFTVAADLGAAPSISMAFAYRNIPDVLYDIAETSRENGTRLYFDVVPISQDDGTLGWQFRTYTGQPGADRTGMDQIMFSTEFGNLHNPNLTFDYTRERNVVYSGGRGLETERVVVEVEDTTRSKASPWARSEKFFNCSGQAETTAQVTAAGEGELSQHKPIIDFMGVLTDSPSMKFGVDWDFGYLVMIGYRGYQYEAVINWVMLELDGEGKKIINAGFEVIDD